MLTTGFNRRFSPAIQKIKQQFIERKSPLIINYRMNAGHIPKDHWVHDPIEGGGRNIGEACHIYDVFTYLTESRVTHVSANAITPSSSYDGINDNFIVNLKFADGSIAHLTYTAQGSTKYPKEHMEVFTDGCVAELTDYKKLVFHGCKSKELTSNIAEKGQLQLLQHIAPHLKQKTEWAIPWWQQMQVMQIAFDVEQQINSQAI